MGTSLTLFRIYGIDFRVHWSFLLILIYGAVVFGGRGDGLVVSALYGVLVTLLLFVCVTLHEFGHAAVAKFYRINVPSITLLPIGGVASLEKMPEKPSQEFFIAIAGPVVNIVLALLLAPIAMALIGAERGWAAPWPSINSLRREMLNPGLLNLVIFLISTNLMLAFFNLLPAFPMDGGRILRSLLAMVISYPLATRIAVYVGRVMAVLFAAMGIFGGGIFLLLIAFFVYVGGGAELEAVVSRSVLRGIPATRALSPDIVHLYTSERIGRAIDLMMQRVQTDFTVLDLSGVFVGVLTRPALVKALREQGEDARIVDVMTPADQVPTCSIDADLASVWEAMTQSGSRVVAVMDGRQLAGLITLDEITEAIHIAGAAQKGRERQQPGGPPRQPQDQSPMQKFDVDTGFVHYEVLGDTHVQKGEALVLLHNFMSTGRAAWGPMLTELSQHFRVILPDLPGHGRSIGHPLGFNHTVMAQQIAALLHDIGAMNCHLAGCSSGGMIAQLLVHHRLVTPASLTLVSSTHSVNPATSGAAAEMRPENFQASAQWLQATAKLHDPYRYDGYYEEVLLTGFRRLQPSSAIDLPLETLAAWTLPACLIHGEQDEFFPLSIAQRMARTLPNAQLFVVPKQSHALIFRQPWRVLAHLQEFYRHG